MKPVLTAITGAKNKILYKAEYNCTFPGVFRIELNDALRGSTFEPEVYIRYFGTFKEAKKFLLGILEDEVRKLKTELQHVQDNVRQVKQQKRGLLGVPNG